MGTTIRSLGYRQLFKNMAEKHNEDLQILPELAEGSGLVIDSVALISKKTEPPKKFTDETIVKAMEKYGIGTSATRAEIIKKLQNSERQFIVRDTGKYSVTQLGEEYIRIVPAALKSPELTQHFEANLHKVNKGELTKDAFLNKLLEIIREDIEKFSADAVPEEQRIGYAAAKQREADKNLGPCPKCGAEVSAGLYGAYCTGKCGMMLGKVRGKELTNEQVRALLQHRKIHVTGLKKKDGQGTYSADFTPEGIEEYSYAGSDGKEKRGWRFRFSVEFPKRRKGR